jgi:hypothetical protein
MMLLRLMHQEQTPELQVCHLREFIEAQQFSHFHFYKLKQFFIINQGQLYS